MTQETMKSTLDDLKDAREVIERAQAEKNQKIQQLEIQIKALTAELDSVNAYYSGINELLDRLSTVKGAPQQQRIAVQILELRDRKNSLKKVAR